MECQWWFFLCNKDNDEKWLFPQVNRKMVHKYYAKISIYIPLKLMHMKILYGICHLSK